MNTTVAIPTNSLLEYIKDEESSNSTLKMPNQGTLKDDQNNENNDKIYHTS